MIPLAVGALGSLGAATRFGVDGAIRLRWSTAFPWATLLINISGSLALGILTGLVLYRGASADVKLILGTGFCGGYTTFSTASFETVRLAQRGAYRLATVNAFGTLATCLLAAAAGLLAVR